MSKLDKAYIETFQRDKIINNEIHLYSGEIVSLEEYLDRVTDPYKKKIEELNKIIEETVNEHT